MELKLDFSDKEPSVFPDEVIQRIRLLYNSGAYVDFIIDYVFEQTQVVISKRTLHLIGIRAICRDICEPDGSPCKPQGAYGVLLEQIEANDR